MSRSRRHVPIHGITTCRSEKQDKRICNRSIRRARKQNPFYVLDKREVMNVWSMGKDGKAYWPRWMAEESDQKDKIDGWFGSWESRVSRWERTMRK